MRFKEIYKLNCEWCFDTDILLSIYGENEEIIKEDVNMSCRRILRDYGEYKVLNFGLCWVDLTLKEAYKMNVYLVKTNGNNMVVFTDSQTAKCFDCAPSGLYAGIDIYATDASLKLAQLFADDGVLIDYNDIYSDNVVAWSDLEEDETINRILVY